MCRNIKRLYNLEQLVTQEEIRAAAIQFIRKISGFATPSGVNKESFNRAVDEVAQTASTMLKSLRTKAPPKNRGLV